MELLELPGHKGLAAPRKHSKSTSVGLIWLAWRIVNQRNHYIQYFSDTYLQSVAYVNMLKGEFEENATLRWLYGNLVGDDWRDGEFVTNTDIKVEAKAYGIKIRGSRHKQYRPDLQVYDDMENDENVASDDQRRKRRYWLTKAALPAMAKGGQAVFIGTILHSDSLLNNIVHNLDEFAAWKTKVFQALTDNPDGTQTALWPAMYSVEELKRMRDDPTCDDYMGALAFAQEMQNQPLSDEDRIIKTEWIDGPPDKPLRYTLAQKEAEWRAQNPEAPEEHNWVNQTMTEIVGAVDPAISEKTTADYWAMVTVGFDRQGEQWILDYVRVRSNDPLAQANLIVDQYVKWRQDKIKLESVAYQAGLAQLVKKVAAERKVYVPVWEVTPDRDKVRRAIIHSANFSGHLVHLRTDHELANAFREELLQFPLGAHDDMFDAYMHAAEERIKRTQGRIFKEKPKGF